MKIEHSRARRWWAHTLVTLLTMVSVGVGAGTTPAAAIPPPPLSQGKPAYSSSTQGIGLPVGAAFDGNPTTRWSSGWSDNEWIVVDLGLTATISTVVLRWEAAYGKIFKIQVSADGFTSWTDIYHTRTGVGGTQVLNVQGVGRYVRMLGLQRGTAYGYSLWEFEVYGAYGIVPQVGCTDYNVALGRSTLASSWQHSSYSGVNAIDGLTTTRWSSEWSDPQWISVDLDTTQRFCKVVLHWETAYATSFKVQVSENNVDFVDVYTTATGAGGRQTIQLNGVGRFIRMYGLARVGGYGYSLWEFEVYAGVNP